MDRDRISKLPNELLHHILSFLPTKASVSTSVLSKRWKGVWVGAPLLDLDDCDFPTHLEKDCESFIDEFLEYNSDKRMQKFKLKCKPMFYYGPLARWIGTAVDRGVQHLDVATTDAFYLPPSIFNSQDVVSLKLTYGDIRQRELVVSLPRVKTMFLENISYSCNLLIMEKIISGCPALEDLTLIRSRHYRHREVPKILTVRSKSLRRFRILFNVAYGMAGTDYSVVIDAPRLEYLSLSDNQSDVILVNNLTSLFMIDIDTKFNVEFGGIQLSPAQKDNIRDFLTSVSGVRHMIISKLTLQLFYPYRYLWPKFGNLYRLEIAFPSYALHYLPAFLESCPNLRELIVDFSFTVPKDRLRYVPKCLLSTLECVEINNLISPFLANLTSLETINLSGNKLTGSIPKELTTLTKLKTLDVSNNNIYGAVPKFTESVHVVTDGNANIGKDGPVSPAGTPGAPGGGGGSGGASGGGGSGGSGKSSNAKIIVPVVGGVIGALCLVGLGVCLYAKKRKRPARVQSPRGNMVIHPHHSGDNDAIKLTVAASSLNNNGGGSESCYSHSGSGDGDIHVVESGNLVISIQVLRNVTNNFSEENILGRGGFGTVYKGELHDGTKIAVKRMESSVVSDKGLAEFKSEITVLTKMRHRHLVALLGYCLDGSERLLVYEYMPQGTLSQHLFHWKEEGRKPLEWTRRLAIALDVARGVEYLHTLAHQSFIHRDLKPSNILLGDDMRAKVSDFGLVRLAPDGKYSIETRVAGTFGYLAPEYAVTGRVTTKVDIFSLGVILMELITGRKALDESQPEDSVHLVTWFRRIAASKDKDENAFKNAIDPVIKLDEETLASVETVWELAGHCCAREPYQRPDMAHIVNVLSSLTVQWKPTETDADDLYGIDYDLPLPQAVKKWQASEGFSQTVDDSGSSSSVYGSKDNTQTSIPTRPSGFADSFTSVDGR